MAKQFSISVLFCWVIALLCVWANYKVGVIGLMVVAYIVGVIHMLTLDIVSYFLHKKALEKENAKTHRRSVIAAYFYSINDVPMVAVFDAIEMKPDEVKRIVTNNLYDPRVRFMTKAQYDSIRKNDICSVSLDEFAEFMDKLNKNGRE